jgi:hypothetical protein
LLRASRSRTAARCVGSLRRLHPLAGEVVAPEHDVNRVINTPKLWTQTAKAILAKLARRPRPSNESVHEVPF